MDRWSQLSMSEKSDLMSLYIKNGISSLEEIKKHYNSFDTGGNMSPDEPPESEDNKIYQSIWNISKEENPNGQKERLEIMAANNYVKPYTAVLRTYPYFHKNYVISHSALRAYRDGFDHQMNPVSVSKYFDDSNYNLFNNNCSDATGEALNLDTKGLTTPKYIREQVLKKHPDAKEHTRKDNVIFTKFPISKAEYDRIKAEQIKQTRINNGEVSENYSIEDALHDNTFATGGTIDGPDDPLRKYADLARTPQVAVADNTRVQLNPSNLFEQQVQQAIVAEEERKAQAEFERRQARRAKNEAEARAREAERRAKTPAILREPTVGEISARLHPELVVTKPINTGTIYDKSKAELEEQAANWGRSVGSVATMTPEMVSRNPLTAVALGGLGEMAFLSGRYPFTNFRQTLSTASELLSPSTYTELLGASPVVGNIANTALGADVAYHSIQDLPEAAESFRLNGDLGSGFRLGLDLLGTSPIYSMANKGVGLINNATNTVRSFGSPILSQSTPNTLTRVIGSGTTGLEDAILTAGYLRGNPNGGITTAKNLNRRYLPKLKQAGASQGLYDRFASNALTEKDYEWLHKNMPENWFIDSTPAEEGVISLKGGVLPQTYEEYLQMYRSKNPQRTNVDIRTGEGLTSEDIAYNWAGENEPTFAVSKDIAKEMGYDYENILNNSLFRGDYAVQVKNARTHGVSGNNFPTGAHLDEHWSLKYPMEWNNPDVSFYKGFNIPLLNKKVYLKTDPIKSLLKKIESDYATEIAKPKSEQNLERVQELRNQHFLAASPDNAVSKYTRQWWGKPLVTMFHGSPEHNGAFTEFNPKKSGGQFFFSPSEMYADTYGYGTKPRSFYLNADEFVGGYRETNTPGIWEPILENNDQVVRQTVKNNTKAGSIEGDMEFIVGDNRMIKSADPITYDNNGNVIPLSKRDNFNISDIRYILPFGIGTGATLVNNNKN